MPISPDLLERLRNNDPTLTTLDLSSQNPRLTDQDIQLLMEALRQNTTLTQLAARDNKIGAEGAKALAANTTLTRLDVSWNKIGNEGA